jgi:hypothetical protein
MATFPNRKSLGPADGSIGSYISRGMIDAA